MSLESMSIELMSKSNFKNETWESFCNSITKEVSDQMNTELDHFEKLDFLTSKACSLYVEAKSIEALFYVI